MKARPGDKYDRRVPELASMDVDVAHRLNRCRYRVFCLLRGDATPTNQHLRHIGEELEVIERVLGIKPEVRA